MPAQFQRVIPHRPGKVIAGLNVVIAVDLRVDVAGQRYARPRDSLARNSVNDRIDVFEALDAGLSLQRRAVSVSRNPRNLQACGAKRQIVDRSRRKDMGIAQSEYPAPGQKIGAERGKGTRAELILDRLGITGKDCILRVESVIAPNTPLVMILLERAGVEV